MAGLQQLEHLVEHAALRHVGQQSLRGDQRTGGLGLDGEAQAGELGREAHGADDAHRVFAVARGRVADHAQELLLGVLDALVIVHHDLGLRVVVHGVDGEVAARGVFVLRAPDVVAQHAAAGVHRMLHAGEGRARGLLVAADLLLGGGVVQVGAEGGDLDHLVLAAPAVHHVDDAEALADDEGAAEESLDLLGRGVGGHVEVLGFEAQQQVAHGAADDVGLVAGVFQRAHDLGRAAVHQVRVDAVDGGRHFLTLAETVLAALGGGAGILAQQLVDELLDHVLEGNRSSMRQPLCCASARRRGSGLVATG